MNYKIIKYNWYVNIKNTLKHTQYYGHQTIQIKTTIK